MRREARESTHPWSCEDRALGRNSSEGWCLMIRMGLESPETLWLEHLWARGGRMVGDGVVG